MIDTEYSVTQLLCWSGMIDTEYSVTSDSNKEDAKSRYTVATNSH